MVINTRLKMLIVSSIIFMVVCSFLVYSSIPWEEYETATKPVGILRGSSVELYSPSNSIDIVKSFNDYVFTHIERYNTSIRYMSIVFHVISHLSRRELDLLDVTVTKSSSGFGIPSVNDTMRYRILVDMKFDNIVMIENHFNGSITHGISDRVGEVDYLVKKPFTVYEYRRILDYLKIIIIDNSLATMSNYTETRSKILVNTKLGGESRGFRIYVDFPHMGDTSTPWGLSHHYKWESLYGSHPVNITFDIVEMPGTNRWLITYMHVELENGVTHDYLLENITLKGI